MKKCLLAIACLALPVVALAQVSCLSRSEAGKDPEFNDIYRVNYQSFITHAPINILEERNHECEKRPVECRVQEGDKVRVNQVKDKWQLMRLSRKGRILNTVEDLELVDGLYLRGVDEHKQTLYIWYSGNGACPDKDNDKDKDKDKNEG